MSKKPYHPQELEVLGRKVREASELIGHLRDSNRALAAELAEIKLLLVKEPASAKDKVSSAPASDVSAELKLLRQERQQIRERIVHLLEQLEEVSSSPAPE